MPEHRPDAENADAPSIRERRIYERHFTQDVLDEAQQYGWTPAHFDFREGGKMAVVRGRGFPDLVMYRRNEETGKTEFVVAELKSRPEDKPRPEQEKWLEAFKAFDESQSLTCLWRPDNWDEIESVLKHGPAAAETSEATSPRFARRHRSDGRLPANFGEAIDGLVETIEDDKLRSGDHAGLRRMNPRDPDAPIFWRLMSRDGMPRHPDICKWGLIMHGIALMSHGAGLAHDPRTPVGQAVYQVYTEGRLATLLAARGLMLHSLLGRLFRMLGNKRCAFNWREMARFILNEGYNQERAEASRVEIARAYYQAEYNTQQSQE